MSRFAMGRLLIEVLRCARLVLACALLPASIAGSANFSDGFRWSSTIADGSPLVQGDPTTLRWSIIPDGTFAANGTSNLIAYLDALYGVQQGGIDLSARPWFAILATQFETLAAKTGLTFEHVADDGAVWTTTPASAGHGDIRLAGYDLATPGELGRAELPAFGGDVLLDTANSSFANMSTLATVFQHEIGHALGLLHVSVEGSTVLMNTSTLPTNGPQFDDLYALTRLYGDRYESGLGNDVPVRATDLGPLSGGAEIGVGLSADDQLVLASETDFATVDGTSDIDYYRFDLSTPRSVGIAVSPAGPTYTFTPEGMSPQTLVATVQSDLRFRLLASDGITPLANLNRAGLGEAELLPAFDVTEPGSYFVEVRGQQNANQFYRLVVGAEPVVVSDTNVVFQDRFNSATQVNEHLKSIGRQAGGMLNSPYDYATGQSAAGVPAVQLDGQRLVLSATQGDAETDAALVQLLRNFGPELVGERWVLSLDVELAATTVSDQAVFALVFDDQWPLADPLADTAELTVQIAADGDFHIVERGGNAFGEATRIGNRFAATYRVQVLVDETFATPRVSVGINGTRLLSGEQIVFGELERYFSLHAMTLDGMATGELLRTEVDELSIVVLSGTTPGDYDFDGQITLADYSRWRDTLGRRVLPGTEADGNNNGVVDAADYVVWKTSFGQSSPAGLATAVPEPTGIVLVSWMVGWTVLRSRVQSSSKISLATYPAARTRPRSLA